MAKNSPENTAMSSPAAGASGMAAGASASSAVMSSGGDRRNSLGGPNMGLPLFDPVMQEITRRASMTGGGSGGFDGMDFMGGGGGFPRRGSMEHHAVVDAAMEEMARRRLSMMAGNTPTGSREGLPPLGAANSPAIASSSPSQQLTAAEIAARQQQLRQQQLELERSQRELDLQRQRHIVAMQEANRMAAAASPGYRPGMPPSPSTGQWWICQICNTKAFATHDEAVEHERTCQGRSTAPSRPSMPLGMAAAAAAPPMLPPPGALPRFMPPLLDVPVYNEAAYAKEHDPVPLGLSTDSEWLTPLHCFVRQNCVELFTASKENVATPSKGKRKPIVVGQVGIRCPFCHSEDEDPDAPRSIGSVYYPTTISSIYNATMNLLQRHLAACQSVPRDIMKQYQSLKAEDARSGTSKKYWIESALSQGLVDTPNGIRFLASHAGPNQSSASASQKSTDNTSADAAQPAPVLRDMKPGPPLVLPEDKPFATAFSYALLGQMQRCFFTEADRLGKRKGLPNGFAGLACRHCFGGYGSGRFFPSTVKTLSDTSKTLNVLHNHMQRCRKCPEDIKQNLEKLRKHHDDERAQMKFGSQKAFFSRIWNRLHEGSQYASQSGLKRKAPPLPPPMQMMPMPYMGMPHMPGGMMNMAPANFGPPMAARNLTGGLDALAMQAAAAEQQPDRKPKRQRTK
jgi:hypothetical protein